MSGTSKQRRRSGSRTNPGFTLVEVLAAIGIFAVVAVLAYGGLHSVLVARAHIAAQTRRIEEVARAFDRLGRDLGQALGRPVRDQTGVRRPALRGNAGLRGAGLALTRAGWDNPRDARRSTLQRVVYRLRGHALYRSYWNVLDRARDSEPRETPLLSRIESVRVRYLGTGTVWESAWPPAPSGESVRALPRVIEIDLVLPDLGRLVRLYRLPGA